MGDWLLDQPHITQARGDMALIAKAVGALAPGDWAHVKELNQLGAAHPRNERVRLQTEQMGRSHGRTGCATNTRATKP